MRGVVFVLAAAIVAGCGSDAAGPGALGAEQAVQVAMFEALFEIEGWNEAGAYCVSHGEWATRADPDPAVLAALQRDTRPDVLGNSACVVNLQGTFRADDGRQGQSFHIDSIAIEGNEAVVSGMYRNHPLGAGGYECRIVRQGGTWSAEACTETWIA